MTFTPHGKHLIAGEWVSGKTTFMSSPAHGKAFKFGSGTPELVDHACTAAEEAFWAYGYSSRQERANFLNTIASEIDARGDQITEIGIAETGLPEARLQGERSRTTSQLRHFSDLILQGDYLDRRHDEALPDRTPLPRPDLKVIQRPIGPIAVFGASNFPLAFSTAGGDTASALAAGCPVVVKGHPAHPGTTEIVCEAIHAAIKACNLHPGVFSMVHDGGNTVGAALVEHPLISAVGFTGSLRGGRTLYNLCAARPEPIPFFGELGSINPMFILPAAIKARGAKIADGWAGSLTMGAGQFCTNPGVAISIKSEDTDAFIAATAKALASVSAQTMLTDDIAETYRVGRDRIAGIGCVDQIHTSTCNLRNATPYLFATDGSTWLANETLGEEVFGPLGLIVKVEDEAEMLRIASGLRGQLTCTLHLDENDIGLGKKLMPILERKAGRILTNGYPTGVEVCSAMVHGGPYPASTNFGATSVGTLAIRRFLRPVCYQNVRNELLPQDFA